VTARAIPNKISADELVKFQVEILDGLINEKIPVVSSASDGSASERSMQSKLVDRAGATREFIIRHPDPDKQRITTVIPIFRGQPVVMVQDAKHAAKTARNNVMTGAKCLTLGGYVAMYSQVRKLAKDKEGPLYERDVEKVDRQDDNAASRLLSAAALEWLKCHHDSDPVHTEVRGLITFLFLMGEVVDAYQNREIPHLERVKMVLRLYFFLERWESFLGHAQYPKATHFISGQFRNILQSIIFGLIQLIVVYRDNYGSRFPLLPWLHSTEVCEHVFGVLRSLVKDFTMLDFYNLVPKLFLQLRVHTASSVHASGKETAAGYAHTWADCRGINLTALSAFPTDDQIHNAANQAFDEAENLFFILGVTPKMLTSPPHPASVSTSLPEDEDYEEDGNDTLDEADELNYLYECVDQLEASSLSLDRKRQLMDLSYGSIMLLAHKDTEM
jgi:hypothetical protein